MIYAAQHKRIGFLSACFFGKMRHVVFLMDQLAYYLTVSVRKWFYAPSENFLTLKFTFRRCEGNFFYMNKLSCQPICSVTICSR